MESKINQQQTLFRFVSLRPPQLYNEEVAPLRFVQDDREHSLFLDAVRDRPIGQTKWEAMELAATAFTPFTTAQLRSEFGLQVPKAVWLAANKYDADAHTIYNLVKDVTPLDDEKTRKLWDNLYYHVVVSGDFYAKEIVSQLLVINNLLLILKKFEQEERALTVVVILANARLVLPTTLFKDDETDESVLKSSAADPIFSVKELNKQVENSELAITLEFAQNAVSELDHLQKKYIQAYDNDMNKALDIYEIKVKQAFADATIVEKERILCPSGCPEKYLKYENLVLPEFVFTPPVEVDPQKLKDDLTPESFYVLESLKLLEERTYTAIISGVNHAIAGYYEDIFSADPSNAERIVSIGGMVFRQSATATSSGTTPTFTSNQQIPFSISAILTSTGRVWILVSLNMGYTGTDVVAADYKATFADGTLVDDSNFSDHNSGNFLNVTIFNNGDGLLLPSSTTSFNIAGTFTLADGNKIQFDTPITIKSRTAGIATIVSQITNPAGEPKTNAPNNFGIRRLGIADYKKVVTEVCCYKEAEVSHIENIMQGEFRNKTTTRERIEENTVTTENQLEKENLTDTATSERFEMQAEVASVIAQQNQFEAHSSVSGNMGGRQFEIGASYATSTSKEQSNRQAVTESKEITQRAMERIVSKFRKEVITKVTERFKEENSHIFDNREGIGHVSGVYRYINAIYKNQIYNYGKRLMYEFAVPQPGKLYQLGTTVAQQQMGSTGEELIKPIDPKMLGITSAGFLNENNYLPLASQYKVDVEPPLSATTAVGKAYRGGWGNGAGAEVENDLKIPSGYRASRIYFNFYFKQSTNNTPSYKVTIGNFTLSQALTGFFNTSEADQYALETVPVSVTGWDIEKYSLQVNVVLERLPEVYKKWQLTTYKAIMDAYRSQLDEYYDKLNSMQDEAASYMRTNPLFYRDIEMNTLKRICLSYMVNEDKFGQEYFTGETFKTYKVTQDAQMDEYANLVKFMEQAFEWNLMSYKFYDYFWAGRDQWLQLYQTENDDPIFRAFMQSGMARVVVSVRPGFEDAVMHYMATRQIWNGGEVPVLGDPLYMSIVEELEEQEYVVDETWETVVPTQLIGLQKEGVISDSTALPCGSGCEDGPNPFKPNNNHLGPDITKPAN